MYPHTPQVADNTHAFGSASLASVSKFVILTVIACMVGFIALLLLPGLMVTADTGLALAAGAVLCLVLFFPLAARSRGIVNEHQIMLFTGTVLWCFILVAERIFFRMSTIESAYEGAFLASAYAEAMIWGICFLVLLIVSFRNSGYLKRLMSPSFRWATLLSLLCVGSALYSPSPAFSLAWGLKLVLAVLLLRLIFDEITGWSDLRSFLLATMWSFAALAFLCVIQALLNPDGLWSGGRLTEDVSPTGVSAIAAILSLLATTFYFNEKKMRYVGLAVFGFAVMIIGGGKAAILSAFLGGALFFFLRRNVRSGFMFLACIVGLGSVLVLATPLHSYLHYYLNSGQADTATGRTELWTAVVPKIWERPILGHGFCASKFISIGASDVKWPAGHMHNGFLEVLYNNGLLGLFLLLAFNLRVLRKLIWTTRYARQPEVRQLAIGGISIYLFLIGNGMFNASFGGRPGSSYLMMLALIPVSETLRVLAQPEEESVSTLAYAGSAN